MRKLRRRGDFMVSDLVLGTNFNKFNEYVGYRAMLLATKNIFIVTHVLH